MIRWIHRRQFSSCKSNVLNDVPIYDTIIKSFNCYQHDEHEVDGVEPGIVVPPFVCKFCPKSGQGHIAAIADEDGVVRLLDTRVVNKSIMKAFTAHNNAIFDLAWVNDSAKLVTASGDQSAVVWDIEKHVSIATMRGHSCSLKSVAVSKCNSNILSTGARDGNVMVWDLRCNQRENGSYAPVKIIHCAHTDPAVLKPPKIKRRRLSQTKPSRDSQQSVTSVIFQEENFLLTSGATDGAIKLWDLRKSYIGTAKKPVRQFTYAGQSSRRHGYSCLTLDPACSMLYASCTDDIIYEYNLMSSSSDPIGKYKGHQNSTFYVKSCLSADGNYLLSGSSDNNAYIWKVGSCDSPVVKLTGHQGEVTSVSWCPEDFNKIMTCADDNTFRVWRSDSSIQTNQESGHGIVGRAEIVPVEIRDVAAKSFKSFGMCREIHNGESNTPVEGITANLPKGTANLFSVVKPERPKVFRDVSLITFLKLQKKDMKKVVVDDTCNLKPENIVTENTRENCDNVQKSNSIAPTRPNCLSNKTLKVNKENSPETIECQLKMGEMNKSDEDVSLNKFDSPKRIKQLDMRNIVRMYLSPTANLPNRVVDLEFKGEKELHQVWNNTKSGDSRKMKSNWLEEFTKKLGSDSTDVHGTKVVSKGSPRVMNTLKRPDLTSPCRYKRKVQSPDSSDACLSPTNSRPSSPVSSRVTTPKMRKISAYFQPIAQS
ncbi:denticleless protein homolog [Anneissia japonica]|uniref:denticleless protein homolog n=1 Tax=Anneissia japonica TaxID=1529436 RepID=UPI00142588D0|nr:denticleless protein homolog [Anneissia japonica]